MPEEMDYRMPSRPELDIGPVEGDVHQVLTPLGWEQRNLPTPYALAIALSIPNNQ